MDITLKNITIRDLVDGYINNHSEGGVMGYNGRLDIRPPYQREFVYKDEQRNAVIDTVTKGFPLNVMYWVKKDDGNYEVLDGQQRTISIGDYVAGDYSINHRAFHNLTDDEKDHILDYELFIYVCEGEESEKLEWFKTINIAGERLYDQELRNAVYAGPWVSDAKKYFSKSQGAAYSLASDYMSGSPIRQDYLEKAISWINDGNIEQYMSVHQHDINANELWLYFQNVIRWAQLLFPDKYKELKSVQWGYLYNEYKDNPYDANELSEKIKMLRMDDDVTNKKGIYPYLFDGKEKHLNIRAFNTNMKIEAYERQSGICPVCKESFELSQMEADHITPWHAGGKTNADNCQMLCKEDNRRKSGV